MAWGGGEEGRRASFPMGLPCCVSNEKLIFGSGTKLLVLGK